MTLCLETMIIWLVYVLATTRERSYNSIFKRKKKIFVQLHHLAFSRHFLDVVLAAILSKLKIRVFGHHYLRSQDIDWLFQTSHDNEIISIKINDFGIKLAAIVMDLNPSRCWTFYGNVWKMKVVCRPLKAFSRKSCSFRLGQVWWVLCEIPYYWQGRI